MRTLEVIPSGLGSGAGALYSAAQVSWCAYLDFPTSFTVDRVLLNTAVTGTCPNYRVSLQSLNSDGIPSGTVLGGGTPASKVATFTTGNNSIVLDNSYAITAGDNFAIAIEYSSGTISFSHYATPVYGYSPGLGKTYGTAGGGFSANSAYSYLGGFVPANATNAYGNIPVNSHLTTTVSTLSRAAVIWTCPTNLDGVNLYAMRLGIAGSSVGYLTTYREYLRVRRASDDSILAEVHIKRVNFYTFQIYTFDTPLALVGGEKYYLSIEEDGDTFSFSYMEVNSSYQSDALASMASMWTDAGIVAGFGGVAIYDGSWTEYPYATYATGYYCSIFIDDAVAGGSSAPSMRGGFQN